MSTLYFLKDRCDRSSNSHLLWEEARRLVYQRRIGFSDVIVHDTTDALPASIAPDSHVWARFGDDFAEMQRGLPVLRWFEERGAIAVNSYSATARSASKIHSSKFAFEQHIAHPKTVFSVDAVDFFPCVVKLDVAKGGAGVWLVKTCEELPLLVEKISKISKQPLVFQEFVPSNPIRDLRAFVTRNVFTGEWSMPFHYERRAAQGQFKANIFSGGNISDVRLTSAQIAYAIKVAKTFELGFSGADFFFHPSGSGELIFNEINSRGVCDDAPASQILIPMFGV